MGKTLFTHGERGEPLSCASMRASVTKGTRSADAILDALDGDRVPTTSRALPHERAVAAESKTRSAAAACRTPVYGGIPSYDRREVKDGLAYLRLIVNPRSNVDFLRVVTSRRAASARSRSTA